MRATIVTAVLASIFYANQYFAPRVVAAWFQCAGFSHTTECFLHDVITGEDL